MEIRETPDPASSPETDFNGRLSATDRNRSTSPKSTMKSDEELNPTTSRAKQLESALPCLAPFLCTDESPLKSESSMDARSEISATLTADKDYTSRELARIALVAANVSRLTALDIIDWLSRKFTHLQKGEGSWEKSIKACLSTFPEFRGCKMSGAQGSTKFYSFVDSAMRARYQREYHEHCKASSFVNTPLVSDTIREQRRYTAKAVKSAPSPILAISPKPRSEPQVFIYTKRPQSQTSKHDDTSFMPFVRPTSRQPRNPFSSDPNIKRETSFHNVMLHEGKSSDETMTLVEKAKKIAEIKARPSRKTFFGPDYRLAHVRRYMRQDIHNESDGAWKPQCFSDNEKERLLNEDFGMKDGGAVRSLKQVFGLPENAIPMNDGQTELAFRDGTLVCTSTMGIAGTTLTQGRSRADYQGHGKFTGLASSLQEN